MAQRDILQNSTLISNMQRGPAKVFYAPASLPFPTRIEQVVDPTGGAPATGWSALGITRGGINVQKTLDTQVYDDADQITGAYGQGITNRNYRVSTQLAEVLDRTQLGVAVESGTATQVSTTAATQVMLPLDSGANVMTPRRVAVVYPKGTTGKVWGFVFRNVERAGGDAVFRFDKSDPISPALEFTAFPEIATTIPSEQQYGSLFDII